MLMRFATLISSVMTIVLYYSFHFSGNADALPYLLITLILAGITSIITEIRDRNSEPISIRMGKDAVQEMLRIVRKYEEEDEKGEDD